MGSKKMYIFVEDRERIMSISKDCFASSRELEMRTVGSVSVGRRSHEKCYLMGENLLILSDLFLKRNNGSL